MICARCGYCKCRKDGDLVLEYEEYYQSPYNPEPYCRECYEVMVRTGAWPQSTGYLRQVISWIKERLLI